MYYLNDVHAKYEYTIYCKVSGACPYTTCLFTSIKQVEQFFEGVSKNHDRYHQVYYIDYEGFKNQYEFNMNGKYYKVLRRKVNDWEEID